MAKKAKSCTDWCMSPSTARITSNNESEAKRLADTQTRRLFGNLSCNIGFFWKPHATSTSAGPDGKLKSRLATTRREHKDSMKIMK